jgi:hypothetical protein
MIQLSVNLVYLIIAVYQVVVFHDDYISFLCVHCMCPRNSYKHYQRT